MWCLTVHHQLQCGGVQLGPAYQAAARYLAVQSPDLHLVFGNLSEHHDHRLQRTVDLSLGAVQAVCDHCWNQVISICSALLLSPVYRSDRASAYQNVLQLYFVN